MTKKNVFDPMTDILTAQSSRPKNLRPIDMHTLTPFQRALMVIDGTVTKFIEAYTMQPVDVIHLAQEIQTLTNDHNWLAANKSTPVTARQVLLRAKYNQHIHAYAVSLIMHERIEQSVNSGLDKDGSGIGRTLRSNNVESYREVLWYGRESFEKLPDPISHLADMDFLSRTYRIISNNQPIMLINEKFPLYESNNHYCHFSDSKLL